MVEEANVFDVGGEEGGGVVRLDALTGSTVRVVHALEILTR